ncbi:MAG: recombination mediator RecR [Candidatus Omnitrophica bacterium]|nr:recombination mediator RecR [Candidatus Omnitrophota bacterium]
MSTAGYPKFLQKLIDVLSDLPTIGPKSAERMALFIIKSTRQKAKEFADSIVQARENIRRCGTCFYLSEQELCEVCRNRDIRDKVICVVEYPQDVIAIERTGRHKGLYHVLWGRLSPLEGTGPEDLPLKKLVQRIKDESIQEIIIATSSSREGETTAVYLNQLLASLGIKITRIARGIPIGINIGYIDQATISEAIIGRREVSA